MMNIFLSALFMVISCSFFISYSSINYVNKSLLYLPKEILENSVNILNVKDKEYIYFIKKELILNLDTYFQSSLKGKVISYETEYIFTNSQGDEICLTGYCQGIKINLSAEIFFDTHYEKTMFYFIGEN